MDSTYDILNQILGIVSKIEKNSEKSSKFDSSKSTTKSDKAGSDSKNLFGNKNVLSIAKSNPASLKEIGQGLTELSKGMMNWIKVRLLGGKKALNEIHTFLKSLDDIDQNSLDAVSNSAGALATLFGILSDKRTVQGIKNAAKLNVKYGQDIKDFLVVIGSIEVKNPKKLNESIKSIIQVIDLLTDKKTVRGLKFASKLSKKQAVSINEFLTTLVDGLSSVDIMKVKKGTEGIKELTKSFLYITLALGALAIIGLVLVQTRKPLEILAVVGALILVSVGILFALVKATNLIKESKGSISNLAQALFGIAGFIAILMGISMLLLAIKNPGLVLAITAGLIIATLGIFAMVVAVGNLIKAGEKSLGDIGKALLQISLCIGGLILIATLLSMMKNPWQIISLTGAIILAEMALILAVGLSAKLIGASDKGINGLFKSIIAITACIGVLTLIAIIINNLSDPLSILKTAAIIVSGMLGIIILVGIIDKMFNLERAGVAILKLSAGLLLLTAALAVMMLCVSYVMIPLINKINQTEGFWNGLGAVATVIVGLIAITTILGFLLTKQSTLKVLAFGAIAMLGLTIVLYLLSLAMNPLIEMSMKIGEQPGTFWKGFGSLIGVLVIVTIITGILGALVGMTGIGALIAGAGVVTMLGLAAVIWALSKAFDPLIDVSLKIGSQSGPFWKGLKEINKVLALTTAILAVAGLISPFLAVGEAVLLPLGLLLITLGNGLDKITDIALKVGNQKEAFWSGLKGIGKVISELIKSLSDIGLIAMAKLPFLSRSLKPLFEALSMFVDIILKMESQTYVTGYDKDGKPIYTKLNPDFAGTGAAIATSFLNFIEGMIPTLENMSVRQLVVMKLLGKSILPMIDSFSKYTDVLLKMADPTKLKLIDHYDEKGMPVYSDKDIDIKTIAGNIAMSFIAFINALDMYLRDGIDEDKIEDIGKAMNPIVGVLGGFIDSMLKIDEKANTSNWAGTATSIANQIKDVLNIFMDDSFIDKIDEYYGGWFEKSQFGKVAHAVEQITNCIKKFSDINNLEVGNASSNSESVIAALTNFTKGDFKEGAQQMLTSAAIFDRALVKIDEALNKNKKARLSAMKEFSAGAVQLSESIDRVSKSVRNVTQNDKKELEEVVKQLKTIEESRLEGLKLKIEYENARDNNLAKQVSAYGKEITSEYKNAPAASAGSSTKGSIVQSNTGMTDEQIATFARVVAMEVATKVSEAVVKGLTSGIKRVNIDFKNSSQEIFGDFRFES